MHFSGTKCTILHLRPVHMNNVVLAPSQDFYSFDMPTGLVCKSRLGQFKIIYYQSDGVASVICLCVEIIGFPK